jgi:hypothetical protein
MRAVDRPLKDGLFCFMAYAIFVDKPLQGTLSYLDMFHSLYICHNYLYLNSAVFMLYSAF